MQGFPTQRIFHCLLEGVGPDFEIASFVRLGLETKVISIELLEELWKARFAFS